MLFRQTLRQRLLAAAVVFSIVGSVPLFVSCSTIGGIAIDTLRISLLGSARVCRGETCLGGMATAKIQQLLGYICVHRERLHSRDVLAALFWGETLEEHAQGSLRTTLWRLRGVLEPDESSRGRYLIANRHEVGFNTHSDYWLDLQAFEEASAAVSMPPPSDVQACAQLIDRLTTAVGLYRGDLLDGCYEEWCLVERERLREVFLRDLTHLMLLHRNAGDYSDAIRFGQRLLSCDPLLEEVHRELMLLHCLAGNRGSAIRQYRQCRNVLVRELAIEPMEETTALHAQIVAGDAPTAAWSATSLDRPTRLPTLDDALTELRVVQSEFDRLRNRLHDGVQRVEALSKHLSAPDRD
jgi:DNA-binding SARP family transcriptional activator